MTRRAHWLTASACLALTSTGAAAQTWRTMEVSRQLRDTSALSVRLEYAAGSLDLRPGTGAALYQMNLRYDAERSEPISRYDSSARSLTLGVRSHGMHLRGNNSGNDAGSMHAELSSRVPMDLSLELGAVEADIQLGGLRLTDLSLKSGAADVTVRFDQPNPSRVRTLAIDVGAASLKLVHAGNSGVERVNANVGVGSLDLDLGGELKQDVEVMGNLAMGSFTLHVANEVGVSVDASTVLAGFDKTGLTKRGDLWYTPGYDDAKRHVRVRLKAFLGGFTLARDAR